MTIRILGLDINHKYDEFHTMADRAIHTMYIGFETRLEVEGVNYEFQQAVKDSPLFSTLQSIERREYCREIDRLKKQYKEVCKDVDRLSEILDKVIEVVRDEIDD